MGIYESIKLQFNSDPERENSRQSKLWQFKKKEGSNQVNVLTFTTKTREVARQPRDRYEN